VSIDAASVHAIREEWLAAGTDTGPADRERAECAITGLYAAIGQAPPAFAWVASPRHGYAPPHSLSASLRERVKASMRANPQPSWADLADLSPAQAGRLRRRGEPKLWALTRESLGYTLEKSIGTVISQAASLDDAVLADALWGQQDAAWIAYQDARPRLGLATFVPDAAEQLRLWSEVARSCGWWWPGREVCVVSERPELVATQPWPGHDAHRLHHDTGPALRFRDGWEVFAWRGVRVPGDFIQTRWSAGDIVAEPRFAVRQAAIDRMGWDRFLAEAGFAQVARTAAEPEGNGTVSLYDVPDGLFGMPARMMVWVPARGRTVFAAGVPRDLTDPVGAYEWSFEHEDELRMFECRSCVDEK
jgi:hypothetical protein